MRMRILHLQPKIPGWFEKLSSSSEHKKCTEITKYDSSAFILFGRSLIFIFCSFIYKQQYSSQYSCSRYNSCNRTLCESGHEEACTCRQADNNSVRQLRSYMFHMVCSRAGR